MARRLLQTELSRVGTWLRGLLDQFDDEISEVALSQVDTAFTEANLDGVHLRRLVAAKLVRLHGEGYSAHAALRYLLEDLDEFEAQCSKRDSKPNRSSQPSLDQGPRVENAGDDSGTELDSQRTGLRPGEEPVHFWPDVLEQLRGKPSGDTFNFFISELVGVRRDGVLVVTADDPFTIGWVYERWRDLVEDAVGAIEGEGKLVWKLLSK